MMPGQLGPAEESPAALRPTTDLARLPVDDVDGHPTGEVYATIAEADSGMIRYFDVELWASERHVLVPVGHARIEELAGKPRLRLRAATREELARIPAYEPAAEPPGADYQRELLAAHGRLYYGERYYAHPAFDHRGLYAGQHPIVRGRAAPTQPLPLVPLSTLSRHHVEEGTPDIRGWRLVAGDGRLAGRVAELIVEPAELVVRYVVIEREGGEPALIPVGFVAIDPAGTGEQVRVPALTADEIAELPTYREPITRHAEELLRAWFEERLDGDRRYARADFNGSPTGPPPDATHAAGAPE